MSIVPNTNQKSGQVISAEAYTAERLNPEFHHELYLHLADLRLALELVRTDEEITLLDYGCGGSPYAILFPRAVYRRADFLQTGQLDYVLAEDSRVPEADGVFDLILSTQVLEHVKDPDVYLDECRRLLRPGGQLVLTTHGTYIDHGCPYDFQRWTGDGLREALTKHGFQVTTVRQLTCGPRALFFLLETSIRWLYAPQRSRFGLFLRVLRIILSRGRSWVHRSCDRFFGTYRLTELDAATDGSLYIALFIAAQKRSAEPPLNT